MDAQDMKNRTKQFAINIISLAEGLPRNQTYKILGLQLVRSGTSIAANYRAACRARSKRDFVNTFGICEEEADEACFWLELLIDAHKLKPSTAAALLREAGEITAMMSSSRIAAKANLAR